MAFFDCQSGGTSIISMLSSSTMTASYGYVNPSKSYNFPVSGTNGLLVICLSPNSAGTVTITVTTSCTKGTTFTIRCNRGAAENQYALAIVPVMNFTTSSTFSYTTSTSINGTAWVIY